jgi:hypothetical protein
MGPENDPYGVAGCGINLEQLSQKLSTTKLTENSLAYLIGPEGDINPTTILTLNIVAVVGVFSYVKDTLYDFFVESI